MKQELFYVIQTLCFLMPKSILKIPLKNFGLFTKTTFIEITAPFPKSVSAPPAG